MASRTDLVGKVTSGANCGDSRLEGIYSLDGAVGQGVRDTFMCSF